LIDVPVAGAALFRNAQRARIERVERFLHCLAHGALGGGPDLIAFLPGGVDGGLKGGVAHSLFPSIISEDACRSPKSVNSKLDGAIQAT